MGESKMDLIAVEKYDAMALFTDYEKLDDVLQKIKDKTDELVPDLSTAKGRKEIASMANKVARSKTLLDSAGKDLVRGWKEKAKAVDDSRRGMREYLDELKIKVRKPLTDWEAEDALRREKEKKEAQYIRDWEEAHSEHTLWLRAKEIEVRERELAEAETRRLMKIAKEEEARLARIAKEDEARQKMIKEREDRLAREERERQERNAKEEAEREARIRQEEEKRLAEIAMEEARRREVIANEEAELQKKIDAENARVAKIAAEKKAKEEHELAVAQALKDAEDKKRIEEERKKADAETRRDIKYSIMQDLLDGMSGSIGESTAEDIADLIIDGKLSGVEVVY